MSKYGENVRIYVYELVGVGCLEKCKIKVIN